MSHKKPEDLAGFIPAKKARERSVIAEARNKKRAFITEWLGIREEIEAAIDEGRTSILMSHRISPEIVETLIEWGYSVDNGVSGQQTIHW
jgi:hypothetical protein